jgi:hypothetical protein
LSPYGLRVHPSAPTPTGSVGNFDVSAENDHWFFKPRLEFRSAEDARNDLEPFLRDWETEWDVIERLHVSFEFESCEFEQLKENGVIDVSAIMTARLSLNGAYVVARNSYPTIPPRRLRNTQLGRKLRDRLHRSKMGANRCPHSPTGF